MKNTIRNLLFLSVLFFSVSYDSCTLGVEYDRKYELHPKYSCFSCGLTKTYGERWEKFGFAAFSTGTILLISAFVGWRRKKESEDLRRSILIKGE